ncbi:hypothetical protein J3E72DRAFT_433992 [Bipolaris maydis]|nr:hypothetical protein J3E72DRAFT_433992 [Bipolaris maydis]
MLTVWDWWIGIWKPVCVGAQRYSTRLSYLLAAVETRLLSLKLCADTRRHLDDTRASDNHHQSISSSNGKDHDGRLETQRLLTGFYMAEANPLFCKALAQLHIANMALYFDFPESKMRLSTILALAFTAVVAATAVPNPHAEADALIIAGLEARGTCCTCPNGQAGCGGYCFTNCPQCIWNKC